MSRIRITKVLLGATMIAGVGAALAHDLRAATAKHNAVDRDHARMAMSASCDARAFHHFSKGARS